MSISEHPKKSKIAEFWLKYQKKIILATGMVLIAAASFEAGYLEGKKNKQASVIVSKADCTAQDRKNTASDSQTRGNSSKNNPAKNQESTPADNQKCAFVASKSSDKYHLPTCQFAQKIKPENKICFSSAEEAQGRGFQGAKCCVK